MAQDLQYSYHHCLLLAAILVLPLLLVKLRRHGSGRETNLPPGPWPLPVIGSMHLLVGVLPHLAMRDLARRLGAPLMLLRLGELRVVVASSAAAARAVMKTHDAALATRPLTATIRALTSRDGFGVVFAPQGEHWRQLRKLCVTEILSARRVRSFRGSREAEAAALVASIASLSSSSEPVNISSLLATYVTDTAVRAVVGDRMRDRDAFLECVDEGVKVSAGFTLADLFPSSRLARAFSGTARRAEMQGVKMSGIMDDVLEEHRVRRSATGAGDDEEDLVDVLLRLQTDGGLHVPLETGTIRAVINDLLGAGSETSATTLHWAMAELMRDPKKLRRAQDEVRGAFAGDSRVREEALPELRYLKLVIKETLRLHPAVPLLVPRECQEPCRILGYDVPVGTMVLVNAWAIGRDVERWGNDAEEFRPERFEEAGNCAVDFKGTDFELVPFGAGRRICPGIALGVAVMELALASLLFHFDWELPGGAAPHELDMTEAIGITTRRKSDLWLHATVRVPLRSL
ncbi:hypothetical protein ACQ4PT_045350 [Festuca glaucescens]